MPQRSNIVKSIVKAFDLLELLDKNNELGIGEISELLGWDKSTVHRIITTLKKKGYVNQNLLNHKYYNSIKLFEMGNNVVEKLGLRRQAQPYMEKLADQTRETVNLAILDDKSVVYIDKIETPATIKVDLNIGKKLPVYCTGLGKTFLAYKLEDEVKELLRDVSFKKYTHKTVENIDELLLQLREIKAQGYTFDDEEYVEGLQCLAAPVMDYTNNVVAAVSVAVPKFRYEEGKKIFEYVQLVKDCAYKLSRELGYRE